MEPLTRDQIISTLYDDRRRLGESMNPIWFGLQHALTTVVRNEHDACVILRVMTVVNSRQAWLYALHRRLCATVPTPLVTPSPILQPPAFPSDADRALYRNLDWTAERVGRLRQDYAGRWILVSDGDVVWSSEELDGYQVTVERYPFAFLWYA